MIITSLGDTYYKIQTGAFTVLVDPVNARGFKGANVVLHTQTPPLTEKDKDIIWIENQGEYEVEGIRIRGVTLERQKGKGGVKTITGYIFGLEGMEVSIIVNITEMPPPEAIEQLSNADILVISGGGGKGISAAEAARLTRQIEPNIVIPAQSKTAPKEFFAELGQKIKTEEKLVIKPKDFSADTLRAIYLKA